MSGYDHSPTTGRRHTGNADRSGGTRRDGDTHTGRDANGN